MHKKSEELLFDYICDLRNGKTSNGETRDDVRAKKVKIVLWAPLENGEQVLKSKVEFREPCLVLEHVKRVIWEEDLREPVAEFL